MGSIPLTSVRLATDSSSASRETPASTTSRASLSRFHFQRIGIGAWPMPPLTVTAFGGAEQQRQQGSSNGTAGPEH